jgi:hypothetical protein
LINGKKRFQKSPIESHLEKCYWECLIFSFLIWQGGIKIKSLIRFFPKWRHLSKSGHTSRQFSQADAGPASDANLSSTEKPFCRRWETLTEILQFLLRRCYIITAINNSLIMDLAQLGTGQPC